MFEKLKEKSFVSSQERFDTLIGQTTTIYGRLVLLDSVRIDGKVLGNIESAAGNKLQSPLALQAKSLATLPHTASWWLARWMAIFMRLSGSSFTKTLL